MIRILVALLMTAAFGWTAAQDENTSFPTLPPETLAELSEHMAAGVGATLRSCDDDEVREGYARTCAETVVGEELTRMFVLQLPYAESAWYQLETSSPWRRDDDGWISNRFTGHASNQQPTAFFIAEFTFNDATLYVDVINWVEGVNRGLAETD